MTSRIFDFDGNEISAWVISLKVLIENVHFTKFFLVLLVFIPKEFVVIDYLVIK